MFRINQFNRDYAAVKMQLYKCKGNYMNTKKLFIPDDHHGKRLKKDIKSN